MVIIMSNNGNNTYDYYDYYDDYDYWILTSKKRLGDTMDKFVSWDDEIIVWKNKKWQLKPQPDTMWGPLRG